MRILIVGAGTAGLTTAAFLQAGKHKITIIEKDTQWDRRGYAIALFNNGFQILQKLPQGNNLPAVGHIFNRYRIFDKNGTVLKDMDYTKIHSEYGPSLIILRKELHTFLLHRTKTYPVKMGISVTKLNETPNYVDVGFSNGEKGKFDLVIGADGVSSSVRTLSFTPHARKFFGLEYWAGLIPPLPSYKPNFPEAVIHKNKAFMVYPYNKTDNLCVTFMKTVTEQSHDEKISSIALIRKHFSDINYVLPDILKLLPTFENMYHGYLSEVKLSNWHTNRIVLVGDAAHASLPTTGMGTSLALEDAYVLVNELEKVDSSSITTALERYFQRRRKKVEKSQKKAALFGYIYKFGSNTTIISSLRNSFIKSIPDSQFTDSLGKVFAYRI